MGNEPSRETNLDFVSVLKALTELQLERERHQHQLIVFSAEERVLPPEKNIDLDLEYPSTMTKCYVEDQPLVLPNIKGGPLGVGDLWDCHMSRSANFNLFGKNLTLDHLRAHPRKELVDYTLTYVKSTKDRHKGLQVSGEVALELLGGMITLSGSADYDKDDESSGLEEELLCTYRMDTYYVQALPSAKQAIDQLVMEKLIRGEIKATHVVVNTMLGAEVFASLRIKQSESKGKENIKGSLCGKLIVGPISASAKVSLGMLDTNNDYSYDKKITLRSKPPVDTQPSSVAEMFQVVESIDKLVANEKHQAFIGSDQNVTGVPLEYYLVPITQFVDMPVEKLYLQIKDDILEKLTEMLLILKDYQNYEFIKKQILKRDDKLEQVLKDSANPLTARITEHERQLRESAKSFYTRACELLKAYKQATVEQIALLGLLNEFDKEFNSITILQQVQEFAKEVQQQILGVEHQNYSEKEHHVQFFTNSESLASWYQSGQLIKVLLRTGGEGITDPVNDVVTSLYNVSSKLKVIGFDIGIAFPNVSESKYSITVKVGGNERTYSKDRLSFVLNIFKLLADETGPIFTRFYTIYSSLNGIHLPLVKHVKDFHSLVAVLEEIRPVTVVETYLQLLEQITRAEEGEGRWKFVVSLEGVDSAFDAVSKLVYFRKLLLTEEFGDWVLGNFNIGFNDAPLLFAFKDKKLEAVCFDNLDLHLLHFIITNEGHTNESLDFAELQLLASSNLEKNCWYPSRGNYALKVANLFALSASSLTESERLMPNLASFPPDSCNSEQLSQALRWSRSLVSGNMLEKWSSIAAMTLKNFPTALSIFESHGWLTQTSTFKSTSLVPTNTESFIEALKGFMSSIDPIVAKVEFTLAGLEASRTTGTAFNLDEAIKGLLDYPEITSDSTFRQQLQCLSEEHGLNEALKAHKLQTILQAYLNSKRQSDLLILSTFIKFLQSQEDEEGFTMKILSQIKLNETHYPEIVSRLISFVSAEKNIYKLIALLGRLATNNYKLFTLHSELDRLSSLDNVEDVNRLVRKVAMSKFNKEQNEALFNNEKIATLFRLSAHANSFLETLKLFHCKNSIPSYLPADLQDKLKSLLSDQDNTVLDVPESLADVDDAIKVFQKIIMKSTVPIEFQKMVWKSFTENVPLKDDFQSALAGFEIYWDESEKIFTQPWDIVTIQDVLVLLIEWKESLDQCDEEAVLTDIKFKLDLPIPDPTKITNHNNNNSRDNGDSASEVGINDLGRQTSIIDDHKWKPLLGNTCKQIGLKEFVQVTELLAQPQLDSSVPEGYLMDVLPYIIQRLKMWGVHVVEPSNLSCLLKKKDGNVGAADSVDSTSVTAIPKSKKLNFGRNANSAIAEVPPPKTAARNGNKPLSRLDVLTSLYGYCDVMVFQDLMRVMSQFPVALPLILPCLDQVTQFNCLIPVLKHVSVKWETKPGVVIHNQLFTSPFKLIVALRIGSGKAGAPGKSTILNHLMASKNFFSYFGEPGAEYGKPVSLNGSVELAVLSQETTALSLWESHVKKHYTLKESKEVLLLANLHGDALELPETVNFLRSLASSFIVFFMPASRSELEERYNQTEMMLPNDEDGDENYVTHILVDPEDDCKELLPDRIVATNQLTKDTTLEVLRAGIGSAISCDINPTQRMKTSIQNGQPPCRINYVEQVGTPESKALVAFTQEHSCSNVKSILQLQKRHPNHISHYNAYKNIWNSDGELRHVMSLFTRILLLPLSQKQLALAHLDREISRLSSEETAICREKLGQLKEDYRKARVSLDGCNQVSLELLGKKIREQYTKLDGMSLGLEHFYRELARIFEISQSNRQDPDNSVIATLPAQCAELLMEGNAIEILDGDIGDMHGPWFNSVCHSLCEKFGDLKIFVVSIIGLQSTGKSTLLNALFACKFAVSVGRCTRGLFMRLLLVDDSYRNELGIDAILLIDTEGLGAPEKMTDANAEQKDRLLATFAMSVSNLTLINVLGESLRDLTEILQIVIVTMARLDKVDMAPDILMVQHLSERDTSKTMSGADEFCKALQEAIQITEKKDMDIGVRSCKSLKKLVERVENGQLLKQFRPFKNGATANAPPSREYHEDIIGLYETILDCCKSQRQPISFHNWHDVLQSYWEAVSTQEFALRFKNIQEIHDFIDRGAKIAKVKEAIDVVFRTHRETSEQFIRAKISRMKNSNQSGDNWACEIAKAIEEMEDKFKRLPASCTEGTNCGATGDNPSSCQHCTEAARLKEKLFREVENQDCQLETETTINLYLRSSRDETVKQLYQMVNAMQVKQGWSSEFEVIIGQFLKQKLALQQTYTDNERAKIVNEIWNRVKAEVSNKVQVVPVKRRILKSVEAEYESSDHIKTSVYSNRHVSLRNREAIEFSGFDRVKKGVKNQFKTDSVYNLSFQQVTALESQLEELPDLILKEENSEYYLDGMVRKLKGLISNVLETFEKNYLSKSGKLCSEFKSDAHIYTIRKFIDIMKEKEVEWNKNNHPFEILKQKETYYRNIIDIRLKYGFSFDAEGRLAGDFLLKAIRSLGLKAGDRENLDSLRGQAWIVSSENIRLTYFARLATQVENGNHTEALRHFGSPNNSITSWYMKEINSYKSPNWKGKANTTIDAEFAKVYQEVINSKSCAEIKTFVDDYLTRVSDLEYKSEVDLANAVPADFEVFKGSVLKLLDDRKMTVKNALTLSMASLDKETMGLLGCTDHCPWCGSLCWGQRGHAQNTDNTKRHHTCHQPQGLIRVNDRNSKYLITISCDATSENATMFWHNCESGMSWTNTKTHSDFSHWLFNPHHNQKFNDLMKWFFVKLHHDIARENGLKPALDEDLNKNGLNGLRLEPILNTIRSRI